MINQYKINRGWTSRNLNSSQWACIAADAEEIIKAIAEAVEKERRAKIAERENVGNQYKKVETAQLIAPSAKPEKSENETRHKVASTFNTNRTYVSEATKLKETKPEVFEQVKAAHSRKEDFSPVTFAGHPDGGKLNQEPGIQAHIIWSHPDPSPGYVVQIVVQMKKPPTRFLL